MVQPLLSIVIANYNYGRFLEDAIKSVLSQDMGDKVELIICDAASSDNSVEIIKKYADKISWWVSEEDKGQSDAFNKGFAHATGKYGCWLNADDVFLPGALKKVLDYLDAHPECEWVSGSTMFVDENLKIWKCSRCVKLLYWLGKFRPAAPVNGPSSFFLLENFRKAGGFDVSDHFSMDVDLWRRFMQMRIRLHMLKAYIWCFRLHESSKTACSISEHRMKDGASEEADRINLRYGISHKVRYVADRINKLQRLLTGAYLRSYLDTINFKNKSIGDYVYYSSRGGIFRRVMCFIRHKMWAIAYRLGICNLFSDEQFVRFLYYVRMGRKLRLEHPVDFNEKLQWLKLHYRNPLMVMCADKWAVRDYVKENIGEKYLAPCIGVYDDVDKIPFDSLPDKFVLKATHGSGWNIICPDKSKLNWSLAKKKMRKWLKSDFSKVGREWQYHEIKPQIICEEFLVDGLSPVLRDYKLFTFKGETKYIWVDFVENACDAQMSKSANEVGYSNPKAWSSENHYRNFYDKDWNFMPSRGSLYPCKDTDAIMKPKCLVEMLDVARKLAANFPQCRVDLYVINNERIVFGELTFTSANGCNEFYPESFSEELGSYIELKEAR